MEFIDLLQRRTCIRSYKNAPMTQEQMRAILEAGIRAPNACNYQSWHFYAVCSKEKIQGLSPDIANISWIADIPFVIVVCIDERIAGILEKKFGERGRMFAVQDTAGAVNHMLLRAADLGLGGCWIGPMNTERCKAHLGIAETHTPVAILTIGTPAAEMPVRNRHPLEEVVTMIGEWPETGAKSQEDKPFALEHASLPNAVFEDLNLRGAVFNNICLEEAHFTDINMAKTSYSGLTLAESYFGCVEFNGAIFENPSFDGATFKKCSFRNVTFEDCEFQAELIAKDGTKISLQ